MRILFPGKALSFSIFLLLAVFLLAADSYAQEMTPVAGTIEAGITEADTLMVEEADQHTVTLGVAEGTNTSTAETSFMDGAKTTITMFSDLTMGTGTHQGYIIFEKDGNKTVGKWSGEVTTTMIEEGQPMTSFEGTFAFISGEGEFEGIKGEGTYKGAFTAADAFTTEWQGQYTTGK
jgi:fibronectin type 3 domain-containing protein